MNLIQKFLVNNDCYKENRKISVKGLMLHSTGANNPHVKRYVSDNGEILGVNQYNNDWNRSGSNVCVHGFIGYDKNRNIVTVQTLPWNHRAWHCGAAANNTHISIEICEDGLANVEYFNAVYKEATELFAYLCKEFNLNPLTDIICHSEGYKKGIASNHSDVMHWFPLHGKSMDTFRTDVQALLTQNKEENSTSYPILKKGSKGDFVRIAQEKMIQKGYLLPKFGPDSDFGDETETIVKQLQKDAKIKVDGIIGPDTWVVLNSDFVRPNKPKYPGKLIKQGQISDDVEKIQNRLIELGYSCGPTGADKKFGTNTAKAVEKFQKDNNLVPDKIVGPKTWDKLFQ